MSYFDFIDSFTKGGKPVTDLSRIKGLLDAIGNPEKELKFIHIAGTNGKGSTAQMFYEILLKAGVKAGLFTSPYIIDFTDRIRFMGENISRDILEELLPLLKSAVKGSDYSQFEITMATAFLYYKSVGAEAVVLEAGLGGTLDCTNAIQNPLLSVITSISHDHMGILGDTLEKIAFQKAGIIKRKTPCVLACDNDGAVMEVIKTAAEKQDSPLIIPDENKLLVDSDLTFGGEFVYKNRKYDISMSGEHQVTNALNVIEGAEILKKYFPITGDNIYDGIKAAKVIGRCEILSFSPLVILDGCHNDGGIKALAKVLKNVPEPTAIIGMLKDKNAQNAILPLVPICRKFITVSGFNPNAYSTEKLRDIITSLGAKAQVGECVEKEYKKALSGEYGNAVILGSLYLVADVKAIDN